jgi:hypothetical protein
VMLGIVEPHRDATSCSRRHYVCHQSARIASGDWSSDVCSSDLNHSVPTGF